MKSLLAFIALFVTSVAWLPTAHAQKPAQTPAAAAPTPSAAEPKASLTPTQISTIYTQVSQNLNAGAYEAASARIESFLKHTPQDPQMRFFKGVLQSQQGQTEQAQATFLALTQDYPELPEPYNNLAVIYASQNRLDDARSALEMAIRTNPSYAIAQENLGDVYARLAAQAYQKASELDGNNPSAAAKQQAIQPLLTANP